MAEIKLTDAQQEALYAIAFDTGFYTRSAASQLAKKGLLTAIYEQQGRKQVIVGWQLTELGQQLADSIYN